MLVAAASILAVAWLVVIVGVLAVCRAAAEGDASPADGVTIAPVSRLRCDLPLSCVE